MLIIKKKNDRSSAAGAESKSNDESRYRVEANIIGAEAN